MKAISERRAQLLAQLEVANRKLLVECRRCGEDVACVREMRRRKAAR